jgi:comEA protein
VARARSAHAVVCFLAASLAVGSLVLLARRVEPALEPERAGATEGAPVARDASPTPTAPIDVNAASALELTALPGIGPVRAEAIVRLRDERGAFGSIDELLDVKGIGPVTLERLRPLVAAGGRPLASERERATRPDSVARGSEAPG